MVTNNVNKNKKFFIEKLLKENKGAKSELARYMNISNQAINQFFVGGAKTIGTRKKYTKGFNSCFEVDYSYKELFSLID